MHREHVMVKSLLAGNKVVTTKVRIAELGDYQGYQGERGCLVFRKLL